MFPWHKLEVTHITQFCAESLPVLNEWTHIRNIVSEIPPGAQFIAVKQEAPVWKQIMK